MCPSVPTIVSVDAFVTPTAGVRHGNDVVYAGETFPDPLIIDYDLIKTASPELNLTIAGIGDIPLIHTVVFDWEFANKNGQSGYPFSMLEVQKEK